VTTVYLLTYTPTTTTKSFNSQSKQKSTDKLKKPSEKSELLGRQLTFYNSPIHKEGFGELFVEEAGV
jgi:hypothetical protein